MNFFERIHELTQFASANRGKAFNGWSDETIYFYLAFHALCDSLFVMRGKDGKITTVGVATPCWINDIGQKFSWKKPDINGDCLMIWEVVGNRTHCGLLVKKALNKFKNVKSFYAFRMKDKETPSLVNISNKTMRRFIYG